MKRQNKFIGNLLIVISVCFLFQCKKDIKSSLNLKDDALKNHAMTINKSKYGTTPDGISIDCFTLKNKNGVEVEIINYGGIIKSIKVPNKKGVIENVVLGYDSLPQYINGDSYLGATIGRFGNRIANGKFTLDGKEYTLALNNAPNSLHGGDKGFDNVVWNATTKSDKNSVSLVLNYLSKDMEEGFPGNVNTTVTFTLNSDNALDILYEATTDKKTIINLTNHSYFNLSGNFKNDILDHKLQILGDKMLAVNKNLIPIGEPVVVSGTPFDFRTFKTIGDDIEAENEQMKFGSGYDHNWVLNNQNEGTRLIAKAYHEESGRVLEVFSDEPGVQFYTGNFLNGNHGKRTGFCLETQHYPDSPNQPNFPSVVLNVDDIYTSNTTYKFSVK
ncbi:galactose mutarotase [Aureibaculum sp. A20]|uniref:Aldose 1-epimerase n=1 Tax=Aureibaculum flavum TaxID=2795986 RepID=A0ABS0WNN5_9FLAO|nr:aldose epimerase family protein [Aureibaculum flavum]MBJ2173574.1 galactose mutarotase [Aureibaculum flavum]